MSLYPMVIYVRALELPTPSAALVLLYMVRFQHCTPLWQYLLAFLVYFPYCNDVGAIWISSLGKFCLDLCPLKTKKLGSSLFSLLIEFFSLDVTFKIKYNWFIMLYLFHQYSKVIQLYTRYSPDSFLVILFYKIVSILPWARQLVLFVGYLF